MGFHRRKVRFYVRYFTNRTRINILIMVCVLGVLYFNNFIIKLFIILPHSTKQIVLTNYSEVTYPLTLSGGFILNNEFICPRDRNVTALVLVHTAAQHFERRRNIRSTYGSKELFLPYEVRVVFLLGFVENLEIQEKIQEEHIKHGDTIQGNFIDTYHNLTNKGIMGFRWILNHCKNVNYVIKTDDDVIFDMWRFLDNLNSFKLTKSIFCTPIENGKIFREGKWTVPQNQFVGMRTWPWTYCQGFVVIMTGDVISKLFYAAHVTPFLWIDDVYLFGYLPSQAKDITIRPMPKMLQLDPEPEGGICLSVARSKCPMLAVGVDEKMFSLHWEVIKLRNNKSISQFPERPQKNLCFYSIKLYLLRKITFRHYLFDFCSIRGITWIF